MKSTLDNIMNNPGEEEFDELFKPAKVYNPFVASAQFVKPSQLYGEFGESLSKSDVVKNSNIYFIVEHYNIKFDMQKTRIDNKGYLHACFLIGNRARKKITILLAEYITGERIKKSLMVGVKDWEDYQRKSRKYFPNEMTGLIINHKKSDENALYIGLYTKHFGTEICLLPYYILCNQKVNIGGYGNILYIGQSRNVTKRTLKHDKLQRALSETSKNKDIYLYFLEFYEARQAICLEGEELLEFSRKAGKEELFDRDRINLIEMALINYFTPVYNETFTKSNIPMNKQVDKLLRLTKFTDLIVEISIDNPFFRFGSNAIKPKQDHMIIYHLG